MLIEILVFVAVIFFLGFLAWAVEGAPMVSASFKPFITWILIVLAGFITILFILGMIGYGPGLHLLN